MCKNNIKLIYLSFIHRTCKFEKHKQSFLSENYEQISPNKKHTQSLPSGNYNLTRHGHARATSADSIPLRLLQHFCSL